MHNHVMQFQLFLNQFQYLTGQFTRLHICVMEKRSNAELLHILQTIKGSAVNLLLLYEEYLQESIYTLTDTPPGAENGDDQMACMLHTIRKATLSVPPSRLPIIIDFLEELKNNQPGNQ